MNITILTDMRLYTQNTLHSVNYNMTLKIYDIEKRKTLNKIEGYCI